MSSLPHSRTRYVRAKCRCATCRSANQAYSRRRQRLRGYGTWAPFVDATPVRNHLIALQADGMGTPQIGLLTGISHQVVLNIIQGQPHRGTGPARQVRPATAAALLAVTADLANLADGAILPPHRSVGVTRRLQALVALGWSKPQLARQLGSSKSQLQLATAGRPVTAGWARRVIDLYERLWNTAPPTATRGQRAAVSKSRDYAADRGWASPMQWDDDKIDDPAGRPSTAGLVRAARELAGGTQ